MGDFFKKMSEMSQDNVIFLYGKHVYLGCNTKILYIGDYLKKITFIELEASE